MGARGRGDELPEAAGRRGRAAALVAAAASVLLLSGCAQPEDIVCTAVGYSQTLTVVVEGDHSAIAGVTICGDGACVQPQDPNAEWMITEAIPRQGSEGTWVAPLTYFTEPLLVRTTDAQGEILSEWNVEPDWVLTGGTPECGGPTAAEVTLSL